MSKKSLYLKPIRDGVGCFWWGRGLDDLTGTAPTALCHDILGEFFRDLKTTEPISMVVSTKPHPEAYKVRGKPGHHHYIEVDPETGESIEDIIVSESISKFIGPNWVYLSIEVEA